MSLPAPKISLIGPPNVGKSMLFNLLCQQHSVVSNYPGTTVELSRGRAYLGQNTLEIIDTPGTYSLNAVTEEEKITRRLIFEEQPDLVIQVADACNLPRMLALTAELLETGLPFILLINLMDEAEKAGIVIKEKQLSRRLGVPVITSSLVQKRGFNELIKAMLGVLREQKKPGKIICKPEYPNLVERYLEESASRIKESGSFSRRFLSLMCLTMGSLERKQAQRKGLFRVASTWKPPANKEKLIQETRNTFFRWSQRVLKGVFWAPASPKTDFSEKLSEFMIHPWTGTLVLVLILWGFYQVVGVLGAGHLVDLLEAKLFSDLVIPFLENIIHRHIPFTWLQNLMVGPYGIITLGIRYTLAIIMPVVFLFFLMFSLIEDGGYLPRMAYLLNSLISKIGLNGKAVIPLTLGLGCGTLGVLVTRTLETRREKVITIFLLSLSIPCSAQLAIIMSLLSDTGTGLWLWFMVILIVFLGTGYLFSIFFSRGEAPVFCMEIPPLRMPRLSSVLSKTLARARWYLIEVLPMFIMASVVIWAMELIGALDALMQLMVPPLEAIGLPREASMILVLGFLRRDYGAAGLFELTRTSLLIEPQVIILAVVLTLFLPCLAQLMVLIREQGGALSLAVVLASAIISWSAGLLLYNLFSLWVNF